MTKLSKIIYWGMLFICLLSIVSDIITTDYTHAMTQLGTLCWVGVAFMYEKRCIKLQKQIDETNGHN